MIDLLTKSVVETQTTRHAGRTITLVKDAEGYWGWIVGTHILLPVFRYMSIARDDAKRHVDGRQR